MVSYVGVVSLWFYFFSPSFCVLERLCFMIAAFSRSLHMYLCNLFYIIVIKHGFSCINIRQVPWEVLKTEAKCHGFQHLPRDLANVIALKNHVRSLLLHKNWKHFLHFALFLALFCFARTLFARTIPVLGQGSTNLVTAVILWPRYEHIESCVAVH